ncbi:MAG: hypothetical protein ACT4QD_05995 [Acidobacteriota bacterium]
MRRYPAAACLGALLLPAAGSAQAPLAYDGTFIFTRIRYGSGFASDLFEGSLRQRQSLFC